MTSSIDDDDDMPLCCLSGVVGCSGAGSLGIGAPVTSICVSCAHSDNSCDATTLVAHAKSSITAGHTFLDDEGEPMATAAAIDAVHAYTLLCPPYMDSTGGREWDCSRWLTSLLSSAEGRAAAGLVAPTRVLELGAGTGDLALALVGAEGFGAAGLQLYVATDVEGRVGAMHERIDARGLAGVLRASALVWGEKVEETFDLILVCETLHWKGDMDDASDTLVPLADTLASACLGRPTTALVAHRERAPEREAKFYALCRARGLAIVECTDGAAHAFVPAEQLDPGVRGRLRLLRLFDEAARHDETLNSGDSPTES